jgi:3-oxoacyl-[acyl-carrier protein] reductase
VETKLEQVLARQAIARYTELSDITNVIDFFLRPESDFITGQVIFLGGVS